MSHYEERLQEDLTRLQTHVQSLGDTVERAVEDAIGALLRFDQKLATEVIIGDLAVNRDSRELDRLCHGFVARHLPTAGHLRYVSSMMRVNVVLERIGDYAETISRTVLQLSGRPSNTITECIEMMSAQSLRLFRDSRQAYFGRNAEAAYEALGLSTNSVKSFDRVVKDLVTIGDQSRQPTYELFALLACFNRLERIIHQSKNICEETIFAATGKMKSRKKFNFLMVDKTNTGASLLVEAIFKRTYPDSGKHFSCGWEAGDSVDPAYIAFAEERGLDLTGLGPKSFKDLDLDFTDVDVIMALEEDAPPRFPRPGFHTIVVDCSINPEQGPNAAFETIAAFLEDLMLKLRGERWDAL